MSGDVSCDNHVTVLLQSGEEKALRKLLRKEEKKLARGRKEGAGGDDHATQLKALGFDPGELRKQRYNVQYNIRLMRLERIY